MDTRSSHFDYALVGGGLQNGLIALALRRLQPRARIALIEQADHLGGNHTWCFHAADVPDEAWDIVEPLIAHRWGGYRVMFPRHQRTLHSPYAAITSQRFAQAVSDALDTDHTLVLTNTAAIAIGAHHVSLADGRRLTAELVVDARGPDRHAVDASTAGYQKFVGLEVHSPGHGIEVPWMMDATVDQHDDFRFVYVLPFGPDHLLVEDTRFSDSAQLDIEAMTRAVLDYAATRDLSIRRVIRCEHGVLPLPWTGGVELPGDDEPIVAGYQGGWFHPVTGYSFPVAFRLALCIAAATPAEVRGRLAPLAANQHRQLAFCHRLNRMLFTWFAPNKRLNVLERFYTLPEPVIRRFYAMALTRMDRARILLGRPPRGMSYRAALLGRSPA